MHAPGFQVLRPLWQIVLIVEASTKASVGAGRPKLCCMEGPAFMACVRRIRGCGFRRPARAGRVGEQIFSFPVPRRQWARILLHEQKLVCSSAALPPDLASAGAARSIQSAAVVSGPAAPQSLVSDTADPGDCALEGLHLQTRGAIKAIDRF